jgi:hypothetical protein
VNLLHYQDYTLNPGNLDIDLVTGLLDSLGSALPAFARIKVIMLWLRASPAVASVSLGGAATPWVGPWGSGALLIRNGPANADGYGGMYGQAAFGATGFVVTPATAHLLRLTNPDPTLQASLRLLLAGCSI